MELIAGMTAPAVISNDVRAMEDGDRDAIRASEDPDALLALRIQLLAANSGKWRRAVAFSIGAIGILTGVLIINLASTAVIVSLAAVLVGLFAVGAGHQVRRVARHHKFQTPAARGQGLTACLMSPQGYPMRQNRARLPLWAGIRP